MITFDLLREKLIRGSTDENGYQTIFEVISKIVQEGHSVLTEVITFRSHQEISDQQDVESLTNDSAAMIIRQFNDLSESDLVEGWQDANLVKAVMESNEASVIHHDTTDEVSIANGGQSDDVVEMVVETDEAVVMRHGTTSEKDLNEGEQEDAVIFKDSDRTEHTGVDDDTQTTTISFESFRKTLIQKITVEDEDEAPFETLSKISREGSSISTEIPLLKSRKKLIEKAFLLEEVKINEKLKYFQSVIICLNTLVERDLVHDWQNDHAVRILTGIDGLSDVEIGDVPLPEVPVLLTDILLPPINKEAGFSEKKLSKFNQAMINAQNKMGEEEFGLAYEFSETAFNIAGNLPQVYEFLLLSFLKKEKAEQIIGTALNGDDKLFLRLNMLSHKLKNLSIKKGNEKYRTPTYQNSLHETARSLLAELKRRYLAIRFDYFFSVQENQAARQKVRGVFDFAKKIYDIYPSILFVNILQVELSGVGKLDWMRTDADFKLVNKSSFDAVLYWEYLETVKKDAAKSKKKVWVRKPSDTLYFTLLKKYDSIKRGRDTDFAAMINKRKTIIKVLEAFKVAYKLTGDKRFLEKAIGELSGDGKFNWIILNDIGELDREMYIRKDLNYSPVEELTLLLNGDKNQDTSVHLAELQENIRKDNLEFSESFYDKMLEKKESLHPSNWPGELDDRKQIMRCLRNWRINFVITGDNSYIERCLKELRGEGVFFWFDLTGRDVKSKYSTQRSSPIDDLKKISELQNPEAPNRLEPIIAESVFQEIQWNYDRIQDYEIGRDQTNLPLLIGLLQKARYCHQLYANPNYLRFIFEELNIGRKFRWFDQVYLLDRHVNFTNQACIRLRFNAFTELKNLKQELEII